MLGWFTRLRTAGTTPLRSARHPGGNRIAWANGDGAMQGIAWAHICHGVNIMEQNMFGVSMSGIQPQSIIHLFLDNYFFGMFFWVVVLQFIQLVCFSACMHLVDHWERGTGLTSRMPAKFKTFQHQTRALPGPLHLDKVFVSEKESNKKMICVWASMVYGEISQLSTFIFKFIFMAFLCF